MFFLYLRFRNFCHLELGLATSNTKTKKWIFRIILKLLPGKFFTGHLWDWLYWILHLIENFHLFNQRTIWSILALDSLHESLCEKQFNFQALTKKNLTGKNYSSKNYNSKNSFFFKYEFSQHTGGGGEIKLSFYLFTNKN